MFKRWNLLIVSVYLLTACGGGGNGSNQGSSNQDPIAGVSVSQMQPMASVIKPGEQVSFSWSIVNDAGISLSCSLDTNADGIFESMLNNCNDITNVTFSNAGEQIVILKVEASNGSVAQASAKVTVSDIEFSVDSTVDSADTLAGDGVCLSFNNTCTLRAAVMEANALSVQGLPVFINLPSNTYPLTIDSTNENTALDGDLDITGRIVIRGEGAAITFIDASAANDRVFHVFDKASLELNGVGIQGGRAIQGAGLLIAKADVKLNDVRITSNTATFGGGGGIYSIGKIEAKGLEVTNNVADDFGAGIYIGSGISNSLIVHNCKISNNRVNLSGGGLYSTSGVVELTNCEINNNHARVQGGGIYGSGAQFTVINTTISSNTAIGAGGGIYNTSGPFKIIGSTISGNVTTKNSGGGIFNLVSGPGYAFQILNSTVTSNISAFNGAGIWNRGSMGVAFTTITNNKAGQSGGGIYLDNFSFVIGDIKGVILSGNTAVANGPDCNGNIKSLGYNLYGTTLGCSVTANQGDLTGLDPFLTPLSDNGGLTLTHLFLFVSPVVDAIPTTDCNDLFDNPLTTDQRGSKRQNMNMCDIGSVEF